jgi:hypothetical protein
MCWDISNIALSSITHSVWHFPHSIRFKTSLFQLPMGTARVQKVTDWYHQTFYIQKDLKFQIFKYIFIFPKCELFAWVQQILIISCTMTNIYLNADYAELQMCWNTDTRFAWRPLWYSSKYPSVGSSSAGGWGTWENFSAPW